MIAENPRQIWQRRGVLKSEYTQFCVDITCCEEQIAMITYEIVRVWLRNMCTECPRFRSHLFTPTTSRKECLMSPKSAWWVTPGWSFYSSSTRFSGSAFFYHVLPAQSIVRSSTISMLFLSLPPRKSWAKKMLLDDTAIPAIPALPWRPLSCGLCRAMFFFPAKLANAWAKHIRNQKRFLKYRKCAQLF